MPHLRQSKPVDESLSIRFILPVMAENLFTILIGLVFSQIISTISASALAAIGMANAVMQVVFALFSMVITGAAVLVSRQIGAGENQEAADTIEQAVLFSLLSTAAIAVICIASSRWTLGLLMSTAEEQLFSEAVRYYRVLMLSLPAYVLYSVLSGIYRSLGNSKMPLAAAMLMNLLQLLFAWVFIKGFRLEELGAGLAYLLCRLVGAGFLLVMLLRDHHFFVLRVRNMVRLRASTFLRILRLGIPMSLESLFVQAGYMLANSMSISLGTFESGVYQIMNTLNGFATLPQGICSAIALSVVGRLLGARRFSDARRAGRMIWAAGIAAALVLGGILVAGGRPLSALYSSDPAAVAESAGCMWILLVMDVAGVSINAIDPQLRAGGDVKFVMVVTLTAVWLIRLPLTYLFCFRMELGVFGIFLANTISLYFRSILGFARHCTKGWMTKKV